MGKYAECIPGCKLHSSRRSLEVQACIPDVSYILDVCFCTGTEVVYCLLCSGTGGVARVATVALGCGYIEREESCKKLSRESLTDHKLIQTYDVCSLTFLNGKLQRVPNFLSPAHLRLLLILAPWDPCSDIVENKGFQSARG